MNNEERTQINTCDSFRYDNLPGTAHNATTAAEAATYFTTQRGHLFHAYSVQNVPSVRDCRKNHPRVVKKKKLCG